MRSFIALFGAGVVVLVACGGKVTSVDGNKQTNQLAPSDQNQLCTDEYNYITGSFSTQDLARISCSSAFENGGDCQTAFNDCVAQASTVAVWPPPDCNAFAQALAQCNTTVSQYSDCIQQEVNVLKSIESKLPFCSQGDEEAAFIQAEGQVSAACLNLLQECPITFGGSSSSGGGVDGGPPDGG